MPVHRRVPIKTTIKRRMHGPWTTHVTGIVNRMIWFVGKFFGDALQRKLREMRGFCLRETQTTCAAYLDFVHIEVKMFRRHRGYHWLWRWSRLRKISQRSSCSYHSTFEGIQSSHSRAIRRAGSVDVNSPADER